MLYNETDYPNFFVVYIYKKVVDIPLQSNRIVYRITRRS